MNIIESALSYAADLSFAVFPIHGVQPNGQCTCGLAECPNTGKHPVPFNGLKAATTDRTRLENMFASPRPYNLAVATGATSNIFVLDVDGMEGEQALAALEQANTPLPRTLTSLTGRGRHLIFRHPGIRVKTRAARLGPKIDIRGDGGYIVLPPSLHKSGVYYQWDESHGYDIADAPPWLIGLVKDEPTPVAPVLLPTSTGPVDERWSNDDVANMLSHIDPDAPYDDWLAIGMALHEGHYEMALFNNWSAGGQKYKGVRDIEFHWRSFRPGGGITMGTLVSRAQLGGWQPPERIRTPDEEDLIEIGRRAAEALLTHQSRTVEVRAGKEITIDFDDIPGIIGDTVKWILSNAQKPQPELALLNTIAALGAVFGRRYQSPLHTRTNIYTVGLAGTAAGKNHSRKSIKALMVEAGLSDFVGAETIVSGSGLLAGVAKAPSQVMHLDEFGMLLEAIMDKRGASHLKIASKIITELYSSSSEKYYGGQYADSKREQVVIASPNLCLYGISTVEKYTGSLNRDAVSSGELNRFIVYRAGQDNPKRRRGIIIEHAPEWLVGAWKAFAPTMPQNGMLDIKPVLVPWPGLQDRIDDMGDFEDAKIDANVHGAGALWGRYRENAIKVAMIFAIARSHVNPVVTAEDLDLAEALVRQSIDFMVDMVAEHLADSQHERDCKDIVLVIRKRGGTISKSDLCRSTQRMDSKQRDAALTSLMAQDKLQVLPGANTRGRTSLNYSLAAE